MKKSHPLSLALFSIRNSTLACWTGCLVALFAFGACGTMMAEEVAPPKDDTCLVAIGTCLAKGEGNFFLYQQFSSRSLTIQKGDVLEYDIYVMPSNPELSGAVDIEFDLGCFRDSNAKDQNGLNASAGEDLVNAVGKWYHRSFSMDTCKGKKTNRWAVAFEGDKEGTYALFVQRVREASRWFQGCHLPGWETGSQRNLAE